MQFKVDKDLCIGCGVCVSLCEKCFCLKDDLAEATGGECDESCDCQNVLSSCPAGAISQE